MQYWEKKFVPIHDNTERNQSIFAAVLSGKPLASVASEYRLSESRVRRVVQDVAIELNRFERLTEPSVPKIWSVPSAELMGHKALWLKRLARYKAVTSAVPHTLEVDPD